MIPFSALAQEQAPFDAFGHRPPVPIIPGIDDPAVAGFAIAAPAAAPLANFPTPQVAQQRCPDDLVVWLNLPTRTYHYRGQRWYGSTKNGAYVCSNEAVRAGMRATRSVE